MKILLIHGSPRKKGNTTKIAKIIEDTINKHSDINFEWLFLKDYPLGECLGCAICVEKGEEKCPLKDSRDKILEKMYGADGLILISPMYSFHVSTIMKAFIDHLTFLVHRPRFHKKKAMVVGLAGGPNKVVRKYLAQNAHAWGYDVEVQLSTIAHLDALRPKFEKSNRKSITKASEKFYQSLKKNKVRKPKLFDLFYFGMWQHNAKVNEIELPTDFKYWTEKGWFDTRYYYKTRIFNPFKLLLAAIGKKILKSVMHRVYKNY
ncbi:MAG TPA: NAD(P)H-dependent oxidoreductase [Candidatus Bathyarchaeia archaeon]|nr:NAD(P)H-dependent oxidoreductase [Candidatus Bathyarchaeia archaeon]